MALLIFYLILALGFSFLCSVLEAVILSITPSFVAETAQRRPLLGAQLKAMKDDIDRPLAAILSLNTIAHTFGAAGVGAQATVVYGDAYVTVISVILTLLILVLSEIIPKTLGAVYWRELTGLVVRILVPIVWLMWPLVVLAQGLTKLLARGKKQVLVSREELAAMADIGAQEGVVHEQESHILKNLLLFGQVRVKDIMTPRTVVFALPETQTVAVALAKNPEIRFSRLPIYGANRDQIEGFVLKSDVLLHAAEGRDDTPLLELRRPLEVVTESLSLFALFERLMDQRAHIALVVDEYGGTSGIVTMEDLIETLLGLEIVDEADNVRDMQELARKKWRERAAQLGLALDDGDQA